MSLSRRLFKVLNAYLHETLQPRPRSAAFSETAQQENNTSSTEENTTSTKTEDPTQTALAEALSLFELSFPTTLAELTAKRNELLQAYHPDKFAQAPEKQRIATEFIQHINEAYERLRRVLNETS